AESLTKPLPLLDEHGELGSQADVPDRCAPSGIFRRALQAVIVLLVIVALSAAYDLHRVSTGSPSSNTASSSGVCGSDPVTARFRGCMFDPISVAWLPQECHDFDLTREFLELEKAQFWTKAEAGEQPISLANLMQGRHSSLFVRKSYLQYRCVFAWRKSHGAVKNETALDGYTTDINELMKCEKLFQDTEGDDERLHQVTVRYPTCILPP
ncbi:hypothetical protein QQS21_012738, partial [Conoideocrella luteorostrata]